MFTSNSNDISHNDTESADGMLGLRKLAGSKLVASDRVSS